MQGLTRYFNNSKDRSFLKSNCCFPKCATYCSENEKKNVIKFGFLGKVKAKLDHKKISIESRELFTSFLRKIKRSHTTSEVCGERASNNIKSVASNASNTHLFESPKANADTCDHDGVLNPNTSIVNLNIDGRMDPMSTSMYSKRYAARPRPVSDSFLQLYGEQSEERLSSNLFAEETNYAQSSDENAETKLVIDCTCKNIQVRYILVRVIDSNKPTNYPQSNFIKPTTKDSSGNLQSIMKHHFKSTNYCNADPPSAIYRHKRVSFMDAETDLQSRTDTTDSDGETTTSSLSGAPSSKCLLSLSGDGNNTPLHKRNLSLHCRQNNFIYPFAKQLQTTHLLGLHETTCDRKKKRLHEVRRSFSDASGYCRCKYRSEDLSRISGSSFGGRYQNGCRCFDNRDELLSSSDLTFQKSFSPHMSIQKDLECKQDLVQNQQSFCMKENFPSDAMEQSNPINQGQLFPPFENVPHGSETNTWDRHEVIWDSHLLHENNSVEKYDDDVQVYTEDNNLNQLERSSDNSSAMKPARAFNEHKFQETQINVEDDEELNNLWTSTEHSNQSYEDSTSLSDVKLESFYSKKEIQSRCNALKEEYLKSQLRTRQHHFYLQHPARFITSC